MARTKKVLPTTTEEWEQYIMNNMTYPEIVKELANLKMQEKNKTQVKLVITQQQLDTFFKIKNENEKRGRKKKIE